MLQFMGDNKRLLQFHEQKLSDLEAFKSDTQMFQKNTSASLKNLETQVGRLALNVPNQNKGTFPSDTQKNPKDCSQEQQTHDEETSAEGLTLKELPSHLKYEFLEPEKRKPVIISAALTEAEEKKLLTILRKYKEAIAWSIEDLKGISPSICMHKILLEDNAKTYIEHQRRLNPMMKEVDRKEVLKWLNAGFIYAISDSSWVSPVHVVPKKGGFIIEYCNHKGSFSPAFH